MQRLRVPFDLETHAGRFFRAGLTAAAPGLAVYATTGDHKPVAVASLGAFFASLGVSYGIRGPNGAAK